MKVTYDPRYNIGYIQFRPKGGEVETLAISDQLNIDIAPDGTVYGVELLNANEQLKHQNGFMLELENLASNTRQEIPIQ